jgi:transcriptional regulator with AAA-type ATPase domain
MMATNLLPPAIKKVASIDAGLARELEQSYSRLLMAGDAMVWAQSLLPELLAAQGPSARLEVVVAQARALTEIPQIWAVTWDGNPEKSDVSYSAVAGDGSTAPSPSDISSTILAEVIVNGRPAWADDARADARFASSESIQSYGLRSIACLPIGQRGALYLHDPDQPGRFDSTTRARLTALCSLAAYFVTTTQGDDLIPRAPLVPGMVGQARSMDELSRSIHAFAKMPWPILILGETGTGKEVVANAVHRLSALKDGPFVPVNCGAIPSELAESILFGHEQGSFTGANTSKEGLVSRAQGGTLFLDEAGELEPRLQVKLLRLLQEGTYEKVGGAEPMHFTGRIVAATHRPLDTELGEFREDLYYRLAACVLRIPPLRERLEDVPVLADHLLQRALESLPEAPALTFSSETLALLAARPWPGNVRELENSIRVAVAHCMRSSDTELLPSHFPLRGLDTAEEESTKLAVATERFQKQKVLAALAACDGNRSKAAKTLGVSRQWLHRLLQRWEADGE